MKNLDQIEPLLSQMGANAKQAAKWIEQVTDLREAMHPTLPGVFRPFFLREALIIVSFAAFVRGGAQPKRATPLAVKFAEYVLRKRALPEWALFVKGNFESWVPVTNTDISKIAETQGRVPLAFIPLGQIERLVKQLYEGL